MRHKAGTSTSDAKSRLTARATTNRIAATRVNAALHHTHTHTHTAHAVSERAPADIQKSGSRRFAWSLSLLLCVLRCSSCWRFCLLATSEETQIHDGVGRKGGKRRGQERRVERRSCRAQVTQHHLLPCEYSGHLTVSYSCVCALFPLLLPALSAAIAARRGSSRLVLGSSTRDHVRATCKEQRCETQRNMSGTNKGEERQERNERRGLRSRDRDRSFLHHCAIAAR